jgi:hypothetical protein
MWSTCVPRCSTSTVDPTSLPSTIVSEKNDREKITLYISTSANDASAQKKIGNGLRRPVDSDGGAPVGGTVAGGDEVIEPEIPPRRSSCQSFPVDETNL